MSSSISVRSSIHISSRRGESFSLVAAFTCGWIPKSCHVQYHGIIYSFSKVIFQLSSDIGIACKFIEKIIMLGLLSGSTRWGKQRTCWLDTIIDDTKMNIQHLKEAVLGRVARRALSYKVAKSQT